MTTIAYSYSEGVIAFDSRTSTGGLINSDDSMKMFENDDRKFFLSGMVPDMENFVENYDNGSDYSRYLDVHGIMVEGVDVHVVGFNQGTSRFWGCKVDHDIAVGSGGDFALSALKLGETAVDSVKLAAKMDCYTGGKIRSYDVNTGKLKVHK
jgi:hypothetical protein